MTYEASKIWGADTKRMGDHLLPTRERSRRLLFRTDLKNRAKVIKTMARMGHLVRRADDMLFMLIAWTLSTGLPTEAGIPRSWDTSVLIISKTN